MQAVFEEQFGAGASILSEHGREYIDVVESAVALDKVFDKPVGFFNLFHKMPSRRAWLNGDEGYPCSGQLFMDYGDELLEIFQNDRWTLAALDVVITPIEDDQTRPGSKYNAIREIY